MATDIFAKIGDIKGESLDAKHKDEIEVLSFSWGVTNAGGVASGSGGGAGKGQQEFLIVKMNDIIITGVTNNGTSAQPASETVTLAFAKVDFEYKPQKPDGSLDAGIHFKYDLKANKVG